MKNVIIYLIITLGIIISLSFKFLAPKSNAIMSDIQDTRFEKNVLVRDNVYKMSYVPPALNKKLMRQENDDISFENGRFDGHHYFNLSITNNGVNEQLNPAQSWKELSGFLKDEFKNQFSLLINGERKPCVLHHAFRMPQRDNNLIVQLVFKDENYIGQSNYFKQTTKVFYNNNNEGAIEWIFSASDLNSASVINIKHNG